MNVDLNGQVAIVTGASRGIGRHICRALADAGAHVVLVARHLGALKKVENEIAEKGGEATPAAADISEEKDVLSLFSKVKRELGQVDILVNNAAYGAWGQLVDFSMEEFERIMSVNVRGTYLCCQNAMKIMIPVKRGYIFNISSVVGFKGYPNQSAYTASKHAIMGITKSLAVEAQKYGICVSAIQPGAVNTGLALKARPDLDRSILLRPDDIAQSILYLLSLSDCAWVDQIYIRRRTSAPF
jgi:3-oxoacyl-[acyl-carrier protein] reductase